MKTKDELNKIKEEVETQNKKLHELTEDEQARLKNLKNRLDFTVSNLTEHDEIL